MEESNPNSRQPLPEFKMCSKFRASLEKLGVSESTLASFAEMGVTEQVLNLATHNDLVYELKVPAPDRILIMRGWKAQSPGNSSSQSDPASVDEGHEEDTVPPPLPSEHHTIEVNATRRYGLPPVYYCKYKVDRDTPFPPQFALEQEQQGAISRNTGPRGEGVKPDSKQAVSQLRLPLKSGSKPPPEMPGDVFDRQRVVSDWDQHAMEKQVVFVLGVGGIGSTVAMCLCRLGVEKVYLLDRDTVDASNLNRQMLYGKKDVGKWKVFAARDTLENYHNLRTKIVCIQGDAVVEWNEKVASVIPKCTAVFNCIDYGAVFDSAVNTMCKKYNIPYLAGSTYSNTVELNLYSGHPDASCWSCTQGFRNTYVGIGKSVKREPFPDKFSLHELLDLLKKYRKFKGPLLRYYVLYWYTHVFSSPATVSDMPVPPRFPADLTQDAFEKVDMESAVLTLADLQTPPPKRKLRTNAQESKSDLSSVFTPPYEGWGLFPFLHHVAVRALTPKFILALPDLTFLPREISVETRSVGSWVCVCSGGSMMLVNQWVQHLMKDQTRVLAQAHGNAIAARNWKLQQEFKKKQENARKEEAKKQKESGGDGDGESQEGSTDVPVEPTYTTCEPDDIAHAHNWTSFNIALIHGQYEVLSFANEQDGKCPVCRDMREDGK